MNRLRDSFFHADLERRIFFCRSSSSTTISVMLHLSYQSEAVQKPHLKREPKSRNLRRLYLGS
jgi:hypothetical protein